MMDCGSLLNLLVLLFLSVNFCFAGKQLLPLSCPGPSLATWESQALILAPELLIKLMCTLRGSSDG